MKAIDFYKEGLRKDTATRNCSGDDERSGTMCFRFLRDGRKMKEELRIECFASNRRLAMGWDLVN